jgi:hypothetical protein
LDLDVFDRGDRTNPINDAFQVVGASSVPFYS